MAGLCEGWRGGGLWLLNEKPAAQCFQETRRKQNRVDRMKSDKLHLLTVDGRCPIK